MRMKNAQSSMEFVVLVGLTFLVAILFVAISANEIREFRDTKEFFLIKDMALKLQKEVGIANSAVLGYRRTFTLPDKLESIVDYSIRIRNNTITVNTLKTVFVVPIVNVTGVFVKSNNMIEKRTNGRIYINGGYTPPGGVGGPLDEIASQDTATTDDLSDEGVYPSWHGAKGGLNNIILKLINDESFDIYAESFTLTWTSGPNFKHYQHLTAAGSPDPWKKKKIYGDVDAVSGVSGTFTPITNRDDDLRIPAKGSAGYIIIDDLHFQSDINLPTTFTLTINFEDVSFVSLGSSTLSFTIS